MLFGHFSGYWNSNRSASIASRISSQLARNFFFFLPLRLSANMLTSITIFCAFAAFPWNHIGLAFGQNNQCGCTKRQALEGWPQHLPLPCAPYPGCHHVWDTAWPFLPCCAFLPLPPPFSSLAVFSFFSAAAGEPLPASYHLPGLGASSRQLAAPGALRMRRPAHPMPWWVPQHWRAVWGRRCLSRSRGENKMHPGRGEEKSDLEGGNFHLLMPRLKQSCSTWLLPL